jgi:hypothetical protein
MADSFIGQANLPLGLRNNNPGDLRPGDAWQGMTGTNEGFIVFADISWGIRAMATDLLNKINKGENTITDIITVYAPPSENDTASYIADVSGDMGVDPHQVLSLDQPTLHALIRAIMNRELGDNYSAMISDADIDQGISMVNAPLLSLLQAVPVAVAAAADAVDTATGVPGSGTGVLLVGAAVALWFLYSSDN